MGKAEKNYEMWHQKPVDSVIERTYEWPPEVYACGHGIEIIYKSGKWEKSKKFEYTHLFGSFNSYPGVYSLKGEGSAKSVRRLLGKNNLDSDMELPILAEVLELTVEDLSGKQKRTVYSSYRPLLCCDDKKKTLIIFARGGPIFVSGGKMYISERGIVK